jgi:hypothetical protein
MMSEQSKTGVDFLAMTDFPDPAALSRNWFCGLGFNDLKQWRRYSSLSQDLPALVGVVYGLVQLHGQMWQLGELAIGEDAMEIELKTMVNRLAREYDRTWSGSGFGRGTDVRTILPIMEALWRHSQWCQRLSGIMDCWGVRDHNLLGHGYWIPVRIDGEELTLSLRLRFDDLEVAGLNEARCTFRVFLRGMALVKPGSPRFGIDAHMGEAIYDAVHGVKRRGGYTKDHPERERYCQKHGMALTSGVLDGDFGQILQLGTTMPKKCAVSLIPGLITDLLQELSPLVIKSPECTMPVCTGWKISGDRFVLDWDHWSFTI